MPRCHVLSCQGQVAIAIRKTCHLRHGKEGARTVQQILGPTARLLGLIPGSRSADLRETPVCLKRLSTEIHLFKKQKKYVYIKLMCLGIDNTCVKK